MYMDIQTRPATGYLAPFAALPKESEEIVACNNRGWYCLCSSALPDCRIVLSYGMILLLMCPRPDIFPPSLLLSSLLSLSSPSLFSFVAVVSSRCCHTTKYTPLLRLSSHLSHSPSTGLPRASLPQCLTACSSTLLYITRRQ